MKVDIFEAARLLTESHIVAIPTETVWGLAALCRDEGAVQKIFSAKHRPRQNPLIIHLADPEELFSYIRADAPPGLERLIRAFWPGPLTLVLPVDQTKIAPSVRAGLPSAAFRVPRLEAARALIRMTGPLVAPSANISGKPSSTRLRDIEEDFGALFPCFFPEGLEDRGTEHGVESTILVWKETEDAGGFWAVGRLGAISVADIETVLDLPLMPLQAETTPICPGQMFRHYAPNAKLIWQTPSSDTNSLFIGFSDRKYGARVPDYFWGKSSSVEEVLRNMYALLRQLDRDSARLVYLDCEIEIEQQEKEPLWAVFFDRLKKASGK